MYKKCIILAFEGIDLVGKSSYIKQLQAKLSDSIVTSELSSGIGAHIRPMIISKTFTDLQKLIFISTARIYHYNNFIKPLMQTSSLIIMDRYIESTWAYQKTDKATLQFFHNLWECPYPDLNILICGKQFKRENLDSIDQESSEFFQSVQSRYEKRMQENSSKWLRVNNDDPKIIDKILDRIALLQS